MFKPFTFGNLTPRTNVFLSPMHGVTDLAFRQLVQELAGGRCGLLVTEFVAVEELLKGGKVERLQIRFHENERPLGIQVFGADPKGMEAGVKRVLAEKPDFIELNCGCPAPKVVHRGGGSSLLKDPERLREMLQRIRSLGDFPLSVKVRLGWSDEDVNVLDILELAETEGADLFIVHGRTRLQGYRGYADWDWIRKVKEAASVPVVGNGDIRSVEDAQTRLRETGLDAVSVGRGAMHNPWIFGQVADQQDFGTWKAPSLEDQVFLFERYRELLAEDGFNDHRCLGRLKQMGARVLKVLPALGEIRQTLLRSQTIPEFYKNLEDRVLFLQREGLPSPLRWEEIEDLNGNNNNKVTHGQDYKG